MVLEFTIFYAHIHFLVKSYNGQSWLYKGQLELFQSLSI